MSGPLNYTRHQSRKTRFKSWRRSFIHRSGFFASPLRLFFLALNWRPYMQLFFPWPRR